MSRHRLVVAAALVAAGVTFVASPGAQAAPTPGPVANPTTAKPAGPSVDEAVSKAFKTVTSPAEKSVRQQSKTAKTAQAAEGNSSLAVGLTATNESSRTVKLSSAFTSTAALKGTIDWGDGSKSEVSATGTGTQETTHTYAKLGSYTITETVADSDGNAVSNSVAMITVGSGFNPYNPTRFLDTRNTGKIQPGAAAQVKIGGNGGIPAGVTAVVLNVTVTNTTTEGHITAYADGAAKPETSNLNFRPGQTVPNQVIVPVGANGYVNLHNGGWGAVDLLADVAGYFTDQSGLGYNGLNPARVADTRNTGKVAPGSILSVPIGGNVGVPNGVKAVALNVTVTNPADAGHLTVFASGQNAPEASNLNFVGGQTIANSVIVPVGADGWIKVRNGSWAPTDVIVDVVGYYNDNATSAYLPLPPTRLYDTRTFSPLPGRMYDWLALSEGAPEYTNWALNVTAVNTKAPGHLTVAPDQNSSDAYLKGYYTESVKPNVSSLNWNTGETVPNLVQAKPGQYGLIDFWNGSWDSTDLIVDMFGVYLQN